MYLNSNRCQLYSTMYLIPCILAFDTKVFDYMNDVVLFINTLFPIRRYRWFFNRDTQFYHPITCKRRRRGGHMRSSLTCGVISIVTRQTRRATNDTRCCCVSVWSEIARSVQYKKNCIIRRLHSTRVQKYVTCVWCVPPVFRTTTDGERERARGFTTHRRS